MTRLLAVILGGLAAVAVLAGFALLFTASITPGPNTEYADTGGLCWLLGICLGGASAWAWYS